MRVTQLRLPGAPWTSLRQGLQLTLCLRRLPARISWRDSLSQCINPREIVPHAGLYTSEAPFSVMNIVARAISDYAHLMDSVRSYFALREGDDLAASFSAVMVMTGLLTLNLSAALILLDLWRYGEPVSSGWIVHNRGTYLLGALGLAGVHALLGWREGVFPGKGAMQSPVWSRRFLFYLAFTACMVAGSLSAIMATTGFRLPG